MKIIYIFFILLLIIIILSIVFFASNLHKKDKFKSYIKFLGGMVILFTVLSISLQAQSSKEKTATDSVIFFKNLTKELLDDTFKIFIKHKEVNYYYNQLMKLNNKTPQIRYKELESQISMIILSRAASVLYFIKVNREQATIDKKSIDDLEERFLRILDTFFQSEIFREHWRTYERTICGKTLRDYIRQNFSKYVNI